MGSGIVYLHCGCVTCVIRNHPGFSPTAPTSRVTNMLRSNRLSTCELQGAMPHYAIIVFWSDEDGSWVADVPDLKSCSAFGDTPEEAVAEVGVAMDA